MSSTVTLSRLLGRALSRSLQYSVRAPCSPSLHLPASTFLAPLNTAFRSRSTAVSAEELSLAKRGKAASADELRQFVSVFPDIVRELTSDEEHKDIPEAQRWLLKILQYNVQGGKMNRGLAVGLSYKLLADPSLVTPETTHQACVLGWCIELLQSYFLVADDLMDGSPMRRGKEAWHARDGRGLAAFNDAILLDAAIYKLLALHFHDEPYYIAVVDLFHQVTYKTALGQTLDLFVTTAERPQLEQFTMERYNNIVRYKTAYYSFYLPVAIAMHMAGITDKELHRQARTILLEMGAFFQVQDDYLDCFGDSSVTGKIGTDIGEGKCTWLAVVALQRATAAQRGLMQQHYGNAHPDSVTAVKNLYKELSLPATYHQYEDSTAALIRMHIQQISRGLNHKVFFKFLDKIYNRTG